MFQNNGRGTLPLNDMNYRHCSLSDLHEQRPLTAETSYVSLYFCVHQYRRTSVAVKRLAEDRLNRRNVNAKIAQMNNDTLIFEMGCAIISSGSPDTEMSMLLSLYTYQPTPACLSTSRQG